MIILISFLIFLFGLCLGSFLNVCIYRLPKGQSIVSPPSHCPLCQTLILPQDNIPLLSFIILKGKCHSCKGDISWRYPLVEFLSGLLLVLLFLAFGFSWHFLFYSIFSLSLLLLSFIDLEHHILPDIITLPGIFCGLIFNIILWLFSFRISSFENIFLNSLLGILIGGGILYISAVVGKFVFKREAMGGGDIKLAAMIGAFWGWEKLLGALFLAFLFGSLVGIALILFKKKKRGEEIPFGPFLSLGGILFIFLGNEIVHLYRAILLS